MIARLRGPLLEIDGALLVVDVAGLGYEVEVSATVLAQNPTLGENLDLFTHFVVREDAQLLFGFASANERELFRAFIKINGVGPKMALALISSLDLATLAHIVASNNVTALTKVPGVGKKTAERLMVELKSRIDDLADTSAVPLSVVSVADDPLSSPKGVQMEAESALIALGYRPAEAAAAVASVSKDMDASADVEMIIRAALRTFAKTSNSAS